MTREMRNSGVRWIGDIPNNWNTSKLKYHVQISSGDTFPPEYESDEELFPLYGGGELMGYSNKSNAKVGSLIVGRVGSCGSVNCPEKDFWATDNALIIKSALPLRYSYYLLIAANLKSLSTSNAQPLITSTKIKNVSIPLPPLAEQKAIADFLDAKCGEIDGLLSDLDAEVKTLAEYKKSLIAETVTRGLNPNVPMKSSGIPWADTIPAHWKVIANKYIMRKKKEIVPIYSGQDIISLSMNGVVVRDLDAGGKMPSSFNGYQRIYPDNLLMCLFDIDVTPRCVGLVKNDGLTSPAYSQFEMVREAYAPYYYYFYLKMDNTKELVHLSKNMRHSLNEEQFGMIKTIEPPLSEQKAIADFLDTKCAAIDQAIADKTTQIETLKAYKSSLIYEYVTGKKQVL